MNEQGLPAAWDGVWRGDIVVVKEDGSRETVRMQLGIQPVQDSVKTWRLEYITDKQHSVREYEIWPAEDNPDGTNLVVDEKNGILLDCRLFDRVLVSQFQAEHTMLFSRFELRGNEIAVEIVSADAKTPRHTMSDEEKAQVFSFPCRSMQTGVLARV